MLPQRRSRRSALAWADWKNVEIDIYPGTEHGFNRQGYPPYQEAAAKLARERTLAHFRRLLA